MSCETKVLVKQNHVCLVLWFAITLMWVWFVDILYRCSLASSSPNMASSSQNGIQLLLAAEQEAQHIVNAARSGDNFLPWEIMLKYFFTCFLSWQKPFNEGCFIYKLSTMLLFRRVWHVKSAVSEEIRLNGLCALAFLFVRYFISFKKNRKVLTPLVRS